MSAYGTGPSSAGSTGHDHWLPVHYTTDHTPNCLAGKRTAKRSPPLQSRRCPLGALRGWEEGGRRRQLSPGPSVGGPVLEGISPLIPTLLASLHPLHWEASALSLCGLLFHLQRQFMNKLVLPPLGQVPGRGKADSCS